MRIVFYFLGFLLLFSTNLFAQTPVRATIKGVICDSAGINIPSAMVMLLNAKDSTLVNYTQADEKGTFEFRNLKNSGYLLKISHMSYRPYQKNFPVSATDIIDLGRIKLKLISKMLMEVVIKAARAPLRFRGDTVEYDAASFKVPPGSTVEDLLRRLPGLEVDIDGNIKTQGKNIRRVYVDGKSFFGDDPKIATKNLGAEVISKVQVFDEKSEQAKLTGIDDGVKDNKVMNLSLKEEFKKGAFGKFTAAAGDHDRLAGRGSYNRFNKTQQLSFIGYGNNINQTGVNWEDYGEFRGQSSFSGYDNGDFGFGNVYRTTYTQEGEGLVSYYDATGFSKNYGAGTNFNFDNKKTKFNSSYVYNETTSTSDQTSIRETFLPTSSFKNADTSMGKSFRGNHSVAIRLEQNIDSSNILITKGNIKFSKSKYNNTYSTIYSDMADVRTQTLNTSGDDKLNSWSIATAAIFRHRFKKKGANIAWSGGYNSSRTDALDKPYSLNKFFQANTVTDQLRMLTNDNNNTTTQFKSSMLLTEPLSKKIFFEAFYNFNRTLNIQDKLTNDRVLPSFARVDSLTAYYTDNVLYNRIGTSLRYSNKGLNATVGVAAKQLQLKGSYATRNDMSYLKDPVDKTFFNWLPDLNISYQLFKSTQVSASYTYVVSEPGIEMLMPMNNNDPLNRFVGNPNLQPQRSHNFNFSSYYWNQSSMASANIYFSYSNYDNQFAYNQTITLVDKLGLQTITKPENINSGDNYNLYASVNFPIVKTKLTMSLNGSINFSNSPTFINDVENDTKDKSYRIGTSFNFTPIPKLILGINGSVNLNDISYSFRKEQNQKIRNYSTSYSAKWQFAAKSYFESNFDYSVYKNERYGFNQSIPLLNASIRQIIGKANKIEMRLAAFDIFNRNISISQNGYGTSVMRSTVNTLARYFMLSFSYNIRGYETKLKDRGEM